MRKNTLREISKYAAGLVTGDLIGLFWFYFGGRLPINFLGIPFGYRNAVEAMIFDALLIAFLIYYGWRMSDTPKSSAEKKFHLVAGALFAIVALLHLSRIIFGLHFVLGSWNVPYWLNGLGAVVTAFLAYVAFSLAKNE